MKDAAKLNEQTIEQPNEKYISVLWWISFVLTMILYTAAFVITVRCYIPYSFDGQLDSGLRIVIYTMLSACSVLIVFSMLLSHLLKRKLSDIAMLGIFALGCLLVAAPMILKLMPWREAMYAISAYIFFMLPLSLLFIFISVAGEKRSPLLGYTGSVISCIILLACLFGTAYVTIAFPVFDFLCAVMLLPIISSATLVLCFAFSFGGVVRPLTLIRQFVLLAFTAIISNFGIGGLAHVAFICILAITAVMLVYDIVYSLIINKKKG